MPLASAQRAYRLREKNKDSGLLRNSDDFGAMLR